MQGSILYGRVLVGKQLISEIYGSNLTEAAEAGVKHNILGKVSFILFVMLHQSKQLLPVFTLVGTAKVKIFATLKQCVFQV